MTYTQGEQHTRVLYHNLKLNHELTLSFWEQGKAGRLYWNRSSTYQEFNLVGIADKESQRHQGSNWRNGI